MITNSKVANTRDHPAFMDLLVWQRGMELTLAIYRLTASFPKSEQFGLTNQLRRAAVSVASNIAEGYGRTTKGEFVLFLGHARGSNCEVLTQLAISQALQFGEDGERQRAQCFANEISRMLATMINTLQRRSR